MALDRAGLTGADIDLLILATTTPDQTIPATSSLVHHKLGLAGGGFDLNAACAGFTYALVTAEALLARRPPSAASSSVPRRSTRHTDMDDRSTAILFGDGAGGGACSSAGDPPTS